MPNTSGLTEARVESCLMPPTVNSIEATHTVCKTYSLMGDNLDTNVKPCYRRTDNQGDSLHYFHSLAIKDRISQLSTGNNTSTYLY